MISFSLWMSSLSNSKDGFSSGESSAHGSNQTSSDGPMAMVRMEWLWLLEICSKEVDI